MFEYCLRERGRKEMFNAVERERERERERENKQCLML